MSDIQFQLPTREQRVYHPDFPRDLVENFYDMVETCFHFVFEQCDNPYTGKPYLINPKIDVVNLFPDPTQTNGQKYEFTIEHDIPSVNHIPKTKAKLSFLMKYSSAGKLYTEFNIFDYDYFKRLSDEKFVFECFGMREQTRIDLFQVWLSIPRKFTYISKMRQLYRSLENQYLRGMSELYTYIEKVKAIGLGGVQTASLREWNYQALSKPDVFEMITRPNIQIMKEEIMRNLCSSCAELN